MLTMQHESHNLTGSQKELNAISHGAHRLGVDSVKLGHLEGNQIADLSSEEKQRIGEAVMEALAKY